MNTTTHILSSRVSLDNELGHRPVGKQRGARIMRHKVATCPTTGLQRYRDRKQAKTYAAARTSPTWDSRWVTFACPDCGGFHLEKVAKSVTPRQATNSVTSAGARPATARRYVLVDIENLTRGQITAASVAETWVSLRVAGPRLTAADHVVIGAGRNVVRRHASEIRDANVRWVVGHASKDGADRALLAACNPFAVAKRFDELVIVSGDHAFVALAVSAHRLGLDVHVVAPARVAGCGDPLSRRLAGVATRITRTTAPHDDSRSLPAAA